MKSNKLVFFVVFSVILCISMLGSASAAGNNTTGLANSPYPGYGVNSGHSGQSSYTGPQTNITKWDHSADMPNSVIGPDGTIYVSGNGLEALNPSDGSVKWTYPLSYCSGLAVGNNGTIYASNSNGLYALNSNGDLLWVYSGLNLNSYPTNVPVIGPDGTIYVIPYSDDAVLYAIKPDGKLKWDYTLSGTTRGFPSIGSDGTIYLQTSAALYALMDNGSNATEKWNYAIPGSYSMFGVVIGPDGTVYTMSSNGSNGSGFMYNYLCAFDPATGKEKWITNISTFGGAPAIASNGTIYIKSSDYTNSQYLLYALNPSDGSVKWTYATSQSYGSSILIGADGTIYFGDITGEYALIDNGSNATVKWIYTTDSGVTDSIIGYNGTLYLTSDESLNALQDFVADFAANTGNGLSVNFTDNSSNLPMTWVWDFGDGGSSDLKNPTHVYSSSGTYTVNLLVINGNGDSRTVTKSVTVSQAPTLNPVGDKNVAANETLNFTVSGNDLDGDSLTYSATNLPEGATFDAATGTFTWTPSASQVGSYVVTFTVSDGVSSVSQDVNIVVGKPDTAPVLNSVEDKIVDEKQSLNFTVSGSDVDGDNLTYTATGLPDGATFDSSTGSFSWTPSYSQSGTYHVTFAVSDGKLTDSKTMTITVNNVNRKPTLNPVEDKTLNENQSLNFTLTGSDVDGDTLTYSAAGLPSGATFNTSTGAFSWTPSYSQAGTYTVTFTVSDGKLTVSKTMKITVKDVDTVAPKVKSVDPAYKAAVNNAGKVVKVTFSEAVKMGTGWIELQKINGTKVAIKTVTNGNTLYIAANSALANGTYRVLLHSGCVTDLAGNSSGSSVSYFTVDTVAPKVRVVYPRNASVTRNVSKVMVVCNETMKMGTGWIELQKTNGTKIAVRTAVSGSTLYIAPVKALSNGTYRVILHGGCLTDQAGNRLAGYLSYFTIKK